MNLYVCVKQVPDTEMKVKLGPNGIDTTGVKWIINEYDAVAVEEALKFKAANAGAKVTAISVGPKTRVNDVLVNVVAMGVDEGILIDAPEGIDNFSTAVAIAKAIQATGTATLIFTGKVAIDDNSASVSQMVAEFLDVPHATVVSKSTYESGTVLVEREIEGGAREVVQMKLPAVVGANKGLNKPRYPSLPGIMKAKKHVFKHLTLAELGVAPTDSKIKYSNFELPPERAAAKILSGPIPSQVSELVKILREEAKVL